MNMNQPIRLFPTIEIIEEAFADAGINCVCHVAEQDQSYRNVRLYTGSQPLLKDVVYTLRPGEKDFPTDEYAYLCTTPIEGKANHICCPDISAEALLDFLLELYSTFQQQEIQIDRLAYQLGGLEDLCELAESLIGNPICIHDDWFIMIGLSRGAVPLLTPEQWMTSTKGYLPRAILDAFQHDSDYLETYARRDAEIWNGDAMTPSSIYVNLWDDSRYQGRFVVVEHYRPFKKLDLLLAQLFAQRAMFMLRYQKPGQQRHLQSMDDIVFSILTGETTETADQTQLLNMLHWERSDSFLCIRLRSQQDGNNTVLEHILHSDLFRNFPSSYVLLNGHEQCVLLNLERSKISFSYIPHILAPLCRDFCLYAGISSPVRDISEWNLAYYQAGISLEQAFRLRSEKWIIPFSQCALDHMLHHLGGSLQPIHMASPELRYLKLQDEEKGTQYFETLREFLLNERDIPKTSEKLIIHRTTLLYRLKKIQSMMNINLEDPWERLYLTLSLWILENQKR